MSVSEVPSPAKRGSRGRWRAVVAISGYAAIAALAFRTVDRARFAEGLANVSLLGVILVVLVSLAHIAGRAFRYHLLLLRAGPTNYGLLDGLRIFVIGLSASAVTPARAGDFVKAQLVKKHGISVAAGLGLVFVERSLDLLVVATAIVLAGLGLSGRAASDAWFGASLVLMAGLIAGTLAVSSRRLRHRLLFVATALIRKLRPATDHQELVAKLESIFTVWDTIFRSPSTLAGFFLYSCFIWLIEFMKLWVVLQLVQSPVDPLVTLFVYPASIVAGIVTLLPFSEGVVGVTGVALLVALGGVDSGSATVAVAVDRAASTLPPLILWSALAFIAKRKSGDARGVRDAP